MTLGCDVENIHCGRGCYPKERASLRGLDISSGTGQMRHVTLDTFRSDPLFPRIEQVVGTILEKGKVVTPIDVLVGMQLLKKDDLEQWRRGRVPYLERVISCNLTRLSRLLRIL